jgi:hypothetical protein
MARNPARRMKLSSRNLARLSNLWELDMVGFLPLLEAGKRILLGG